MTDNPFAAELAKRGANPFAAELERRRLAGMTDDQLKDAVFAPPEPPPGVIIHQGDGKSVVAGQPDVSAARTASEITSPEQERQNAIEMEALKWRGDTGGFGAAGRAAMPAFQGYGMNWGDELVSGAVAAAVAATGGSAADAFDVAQEKQRQELDRERAESPTRSFLAQVAGGVATGPLLGRALGPLLWRMPAIGAVPAGAATGVGLGAAAGAGEGQGEERIGNAVVGGTIGGVIGAASPLLGRGIQGVYQAYRDRALQSETLRGLGLSPRTAQFLGRQMAADGTLGDIGEANIRAAGPNAMLADAGPNARTTLDTAIARGGDRRIVDAARAIEERATAAGSQIDDALNATLGRPQGAATTGETIRASTAAARRSAYDDAYGAAIDYASDAGRQIEALMARVPGPVVQRANQLMAIEGNRSAQILADLADDGTVTFRRMPDVRQLDYIKRALDDVARSGEGQGALGGQTAVGRAYANLARELRDATAEAVPQYRTALETAADPIARRQALEFGTEMLRPNVPRDVVAAEIGGMTGPERQAVASGVRAQIDEVLANVRRTITDSNVDARAGMQALKDLSSPAARTKIELLVGPDQARTLFAQLDEAARAFDLRAGVATNSRTYARQATDQMVDATTEPGAIGALLEGRAPSAMRQIIQALTGRTDEARMLAKDDVLGELAATLTGPRGGQAVQLARAIADATARRSAAQDAGRRIANTATGSIATGAWQAISQALQERGSR